MTRALGALLGQAIDYAGLFPPAKLDMAASVSNYLRYFHGPEKWILGRFVCSVGRLPDLARELAEHPEEPFVPVSVIGQGGPDRRHWEHGLEHDAAAMNRFLEDAEGHAEIQTYEVRAYDHAHTAMFISDLRGFTDADVFLELPWAKEMDDSLALIAETDWLGAKARCGGLEAAAFPSSADLAAFLQQCSHLDLRYKLTAGLHHATPRKDQATGGNMHGFLNVLVGVALLEAGDLSRKELAALLDERDAKAVRVEVAGVSWNGHEAGMESVEGAREVFVSFGSCSIEEPLQDLGDLGLIGEAVNR